MVDEEPLRTSRDVVNSIAEELGAAGFGAAEVVGRGGFGVVYRCSQSELDRTVAVKVLTTDLDDVNVARFLREQRAMGRLTGHPNIVNVLHVGVTDSGRPYLVMPYCTQGSLEARIRRLGPLESEEILRLGVKMAGALETAHVFGIVHRDIKPANILFTDYGEPALADFGISRVSGGFQTATGSVAGSPAFTAPEVLGGAKSGTASDIYGLGATLFCALTGHAAFERLSGEQVVAQFLRVTTQPVPDLRESGVDDDISELVERTMSRDPEQRPTAAAVGEELRQLQRNHNVPVDEMALLAEAGQGHADSSSPIPRHSAPARRGNTGGLPLELTSFVGRRKEVSELKSLLSAARLVTLTGVGGVGKTRLALRVASTVRKDFSDGVRLIELGEVHDASLTESVVASALGVRDQPARPVQDVLIDFLHARDLLLVLDNCEHVVEGVAELVDPLIQACPGLRILATSREPLGVIGERVRLLSPLTIPAPDMTPSLRTALRYDAVTLFAERAAVTVEGFEVTEDNAATLAQICTRLDGLPLAIELAAARLPAMSPDQILQRLTDRFALLTRGSRGTPSRQRTLWWSVDWSYELCTPSEQQLWARLSVFAGTFGLDAAESICGDDQPAGALLDSLSSLVDKSILIREEQGSVVRLRLLETLREYGREKLQQLGESLKLRRRHSDWYEQWALDAEGDWISSRQLEWLGRLEREQANLREALEFCARGDQAAADAGLRMAAAMFHITSSQGMHGQERGWFDQLLAKHSGRPTAGRIKGLYAAAMCAAMAGDMQAANDHVEQVRALAGMIDDPVIAARIPLAEGMLALFSGDAARARASLETTLGMFNPDDDLTVHVGALHSLGLACDLLGDAAQAIHCYERVLEITAARGELIFRTYTLWTMAIAVWHQGEQVRATELLEQALRLASLTNNSLSIALCLEVLAWIEAEKRIFQRAAVLMGAAEKLAQFGGISVLFPDLLRYREESERAARSVLGERAFGSASTRGRQMRFDAAVAYALGEQPPDSAPASGGASELTKREQQVADLVAQGLTNKEIATKLVISHRTAQGHVEHVLAKLGFNTRAQVAAWVVEQTQGETD